jgi:mRNA-degrading endonuclease RelE of RelBE toxin-antitoxin system
MAIRESLNGRRRGVYRIFFSIEDDEVSVLAIRHAARGPLEP